MSFRTWFSGVLSAAWEFFLPLLRSKLAELAADKEIQNLAMQSVMEQAKNVMNSNDDRHMVATMQLREALKNKGRTIALGVAATIVEAAFQKLKAAGEVD
jgi:hypothetical protein